MKFDELLYVENKDSPETENICGVLAHDILNVLKLIYFEVTDLMAMEHRYVLVKLDTICFSDESHVLTISYS